MLTKAQVAQYQNAATTISKRGPPTLGAILKYAELIRKIAPVVVEIDAIRVAASAGAEHIPNPATGQDILKSPDAVNKLLFDALQSAADVPTDLPVFTKDDLPKLPDFSDDAAKNEKAEKARQELAEAIAQLGDLFVG